MSIHPRTSRVLLALLLLLIGEVVLVAVLGGSADVRSKAQLVIFPFVLILLMQLSCFGQRIPRGLLLAAGAMAVAGATVNANGHRIHEGAFLIARLKGDRLGGETRIVRERVRRVEGLQESGYVSTYEAEITSREQAEAALVQNPSLAGVVWGSTRAVGVMLRRSPAQALHTLGEASTAGRYVAQHKKLKDLAIITSIPSVGVSFADKPETIEFLGRLVSVWGDFPRSVFSVDETLSLERQLLVMSAMRGAWSSPEPRVFAQWMLGTYYLAQGLIAPESEPGVFECTRDAFQSAYRKLRRGERRALEAAIINNLALTQLFIDAERVPRTQAVTAAVEQLRKASVLIRGPQGDSELRKVVDSNIRILKSSLNGRRKKHKKK